nr:hypothetical protein Iba_chr10aCG16040 [Ipomoea batatas]GME14718.1 hypothetical protein Iba_scaffold15400CG0320 [Ipomoea batatas]
MHSTLSKQCAIHVVRCITWDSTDHISWIYIFKCDWKLPLFRIILDFLRKPHSNILEKLVS